MNRKQERKKEQSPARKRNKYRYRYGTVGTKNKDSIEQRSEKRAKGRVEKERWEDLHVEEVPDVLVVEGEDALEYDHVRPVHGHCLGLPPIQNRNREYTNKPVFLNTPVTYF